MSPEEAGKPARHRKRRRRELHFLDGSAGCIPRRMCPRRRIRAVGKGGNRKGGRFRLVIVSQGDGMKGEDGIGASDSRPRGCRLADVEGTVAGRS